MSGGHKFNPEHAARLNDPKRLEEFVPEVLWAALAVPPPRVILDIGAGAGLLATAFARLAPDATVYAVDVSEPMLAYLAEHLPADLVGRVVPVLAEESRVPLEDGIADAVTMIALFHELDDPSATLRDAHRLLAPGGRLLIVDWSKEPSASGPPMEHRVSGEEIVAYVQAAGFGEVELSGALRGFSVVTASRAEG